MSSSESTDFGGYKISQGIVYVCVAGDIILNAMVDTTDTTKLGRFPFIGLCAYGYGCGCGCGSGAVLIPGDSTPH
jgi:hypothetical protein